MQIPTCTGCCTSAQLLQLNYRLGCIAGRNAALSDVLVAILKTSSPTPTPQASRPSWFRDLVERAELAQRGVAVLAGAWRFYRAAPWGWLVMGLLALAQWLGLW